MQQSANKRRATVADVARQAGVSVATVSRVLNAKAGDRNPVAEETCQRVRQAMQTLDYRPSRAGRTLRTQVAHVVALLIPDATNAFYAAIAHSTEIALRERGYSMILCNTSEDPAIQDEYLREMQAHNVAAIVLLGAVETEELHTAAASDTPIVFLNRRAPRGSSGPFIGIDNTAAGWAVGDHFAERGWAWIGCIRGPQTSSASRERFEGFQSALAAAGKPLDRRLVEDGALTIESGHAAMARLLAGEQCPDAVFCGNDLMAYGAYRCLAEQGLSVADVALFGFDDNPLNAWLATWLSTVHVPYSQIGRSAAEVIVELAGSRGERMEREILLPFHLEVRASA